jgi:cysteinyl-tRNA synthetase
MLKLGGRDFVPQDPTRVTVYVCGPTVYAPPHIGNLRSAVNFDILHRVLRRLYGGDAVTFVRNYTDIDDKIMDAAQKHDVDISVITSSAEGHYHDAVTKLHVLPPTHTPRVTSSMDAIRDFIFHLVEQHDAYESHGHVLFDRTKNPTFFINDNLDPDSLNENHAAEYKRNPRDFVLWKPSTAFQPGWDSPWSRGRPGWHIECSAMIHSLLGDTIDIHAGGVDLKFPHHENECAQSVARTGKPLANYWLHNGMLVLPDNEKAAREPGKMSKEKGNIIYLAELLEQVSPEAVRYFFLTASYSQPLVFSWEAIDAAEASLKSLQRAMRLVGPMMAEYTYCGPLLDDLNTPRALAELHSLASDVLAHKANDDDIARFIGLADVLGLHENYEVKITDEILEIQMKRASARERRDFAEADRLRDELVAMGVEVNDAPIRRV